jgi:D-aminopeptidase
VLNGNGCVTGLDWMKEAGLFEGAIGLVNTHSIGDVYKGIITWMQDKYPEIGISHDTTMPVVAECDDSALNDIRGFHVTVDHVVNALNAARGGYVQEGAVGAGTGMTSFEFKGGIGTASRVVNVGGKEYTVGVLVNCNHAKRAQLQIMGVPVGHLLEREALATKSTEGSIVIVVATDAPLSPRQLERIAKRAAMGLALTGATANTTSGDFIIAFSNTRLIPREADAVLTLPELSDGAINPLFHATVEATAESVWNALCMAETVIGRDGNVSPAMPLDRVQQILAERGLVDVAAE